MPYFAEDTSSPSTNTAVLVPYAGFEAEAGGGGIGGSRHSGALQDALWPSSLRERETQPTILDGVELRPAGLDPRLVDILGRLYIVTDGVTHCADGTTAARLAAQIIGQLYYHTPALRQTRTRPDPDLWKQRLDMAFQQAHQYLQAWRRRWYCAYYFKHNDGQPKYWNQDQVNWRGGQPNCPLCGERLRGLLTTAVALVVGENNGRPVAVVGGVGDSQAFRLPPGPTQKPYPIYQPRAKEFLGSAGQLMFTAQDMPLHPGEMVLLGSDGFFGAISGRHGSAWPSAVRDQLTAVDLVGAVPELVRQLGQWGAERDNPAWHDDQALIAVSVRAAFDSPWPTRPNALARDSRGPKTNALPVDKPVPINMPLLKVSVPPDGSTDTDWPTDTSPHSTNAGWSGDTDWITDTHWADGSNRSADTSPLITDRSKRTGTRRGAAALWHAFRRTVPVRVIPRVNTAPLAAPRRAAVLDTRDVVSVPDPERHVGIRRIWLGAALLITIVAAVAFNWLWDDFSQAARNAMGQRPEHTIAAESSLSPWPTTAAMIAIRPTPTMIVSPNSDGRADLLAAAPTSLNVATPSDTADAVESHLPTSTPAPSATIATGPPALETASPPQAAGAVAPATSTPAPSSDSLPPLPLLYGPNIALEIPPDSSYEMALQTALGFSDETAAAEASAAIAAFNLPPVPLAESYPGFLPPVPYQYLLVGQIDPFAAADRPEELFLRPSYNTATQLSLSLSGVTSEELTSLAAWADEGKLVWLLATSTVLDGSVNACRQNQASGVCGLSQLLGQSGRVVLSTSMVMGINGSTLVPLDSPSAAGGPTWIFADLGPKGIVMALDNAQRAAVGPRLRHYGLVQAQWSGNTWELHLTDNVIYTRPADAADEKQNYVAERVPLNTGGSE